MSLIFREGTWDEDIFKSVNTHNEYQVKSFANLTVLDVGGHVGSFSHLALTGGAKRVIAVEPDKESFLVLRHNLHYEALNGTSAICISAAVGGRNDLATLSPTRKGNTGEGRVGVGGKELVSTGTLDSLIGLCDDKVNLLKLDVEGAEHDILINSAKLHYVDNIVGEYHLGGEFSKNDLETLLVVNGFTTRFVPTQENALGLFWGWRTKHCFTF